MTDDFKPIDDRWFTEMHQEWLADQRAQLAETYGEEAIESVQRMVALFADLIYIGSDNIELIRAGLHRMAELVNEMLPRLTGQEGSTRHYDHRDLNGCMDPMPEAVQRAFIGVVGDVLLHSKGGPFDSAQNIAESLDRLASVVRSGRGEEA